MKNLLVAINAKYAHSSLAIRYLKKYNEKAPWAPELLEFTINQHEDDIIRTLMTHECQVITFSCYIWNYEMVLRICRDLKTINPSLKILLGGPEVSYGGQAILEAHPFIDVIMEGEGEVTYGCVCKALFDNQDLGQVAGIVYRGTEIVATGQRPPMANLDAIPFPYDDFIGLEHKKLYYESSRGCPFTCQYCLSSTTGKVRYFTLDRVKKDLLVFLNHGVPQVKFVDRTFNADPKRALDMMIFIQEHDKGITNFHFEVVASLLDQATMDFLKTCRKGLFQFEIGVQTTHPETMVAIKRNINFDTLSEKVRTLLTYDNIHLHLDLIAGLPYEDYETFLNSFEDVYSLRPQMLQLGFLKLLKGSGLRRNKDMYGYVYSNYAPYEIYYNAYISYQDLSSLKDLEEMVETYYNNTRFRHSLDMIISHFYTRAVDFYLALASYFRDKGHFDQPLKTSYMYEVLLNFYKEVHAKDVEGFKSVLQYDYYLNFKKPLALFNDATDKVLKNKCYDLLKDKVIFTDQDLQPRAWLKRLNFIVFKHDVFEMIASGYKKQEAKPLVLAFDYESKECLAKDYNITKHFA